jgi:hypothetical protein
MSNSASLSAAKRRRGGGPPIGQPPGAPGAPGAPPQMNGGGGLPPGLPPNFRQMPPQLQQQILRQMQQRMMQVKQQQQQQQQQQHQHQEQPIINPMAQNIPTGVGVSMSSNNMNEKIPPHVTGNGPYVVNSVLHNRAISEIDGIHIRDLPMSATGLPCLPSGAALPPNILFKLHHEELLNQDAVMNEYSNHLQMLINRVDKIERGISPSSNHNTSTSTTTTTHIDASHDANSLSNNTDFIAKILDNILNNTNLSDIINQIEPLQKENESLRMLLHSQQTTLNELSTLVMKLLNGSLPTQPQDNPETQVTTDNFNIKYQDIKDEFCNYVNACQKETAEQTKEEAKEETTEEINKSKMQEYNENDEYYNYEENEENEENVESVVFEISEERDV